MSPRELTVTIAPHLQRALEVMGRDMAVEPQALVNQAVFAWLRINGYVLPGTIGDLAGVASAPVEAPTPVVAPVAVSAPVAVEPSPPPVAPPTVPETVAARPALVSDPHARPTAPEPPAATGSVPAIAPPPEPPAGLAAAVARIEEIEADLERFAKARPAFPEAVDEADDEDEDEADDEAQDDDAADEDEADGEAQQDEDAAPDESTAARGESLEDEDEPTRGVAPSDDDDDDEDDEERAADEGEDEGPAPEGTFVVKSVPVVLYIEREGEDAVRVESEHFIIGRGPTCDLIIDSPRVSREHVRVSRQGVTFVLEDLGSSNGTWYGEDRVERRELESGDELRLGNELVRFVLRGD